jgi:hypothetical protein
VRRNGEHAQEGTDGQEAEQEPRHGESGVQSRGLQRCLFNTS